MKVVAVMKKKFDLVGILGSPLRGDASPSDEVRILGGRGTQNDDAGSTDGRQI